MKDRIKLYHWLYKNWQQCWFEDVLELKYVYLWLFYDFISRFSLTFINMQISRFTCLTTERMTCVNASI